MEARRLLAYHREVLDDNPDDKVDEYHTSDNLVRVWGLGLGG